MEIPALESALGKALLSHPRKHGFRYDEAAEQDLLQILFRSMTGYNDEYLRELFPDGVPTVGWKLSEAQGAEEGAEYTEAARGKRCGHVFKAGEASYRCLTCSVDETCALCSRCFDASEHTGHKHSVFISTGHSGCCDCGDEEAFRIPVNCAIHTDLSGSTGQPKQESRVPGDFAESIKGTIGKTLDYMCDVISCSPEQLRLPKTESGIRQDELASRLSADRYGMPDDAEEEPEFSVVLWNDEKHTITDVRNQVARACREREQFGQDRADETNDIGRSVLKYSKDLKHLLQISRKVEEIRVTVTIRSARDTFREQMCGTIIEWLCDISGCHVCDDNMLFRQAICDQMLRPWLVGSGASNADVGRKGIDRHGLEDAPRYRSGIIGINIQRHVAGGGNIVEATLAADDEDEDDEDHDDDEDIDDDDFDQTELDDEDEDEEMDELDPVQLTLEQIAEEMEEDGLDGGNEDQDVEMRTEDDLEVAEATLAGYPAPPPPPPPAEGEPAEADTDEQQLPTTTEETEDNALNRSLRQVKIPKTPGQKTKVPSKPSSYWEAKPARYHEKGSVGYEDLRQRTRLDWMILFDLRLWKKARTDIKELCLGTVVNVPEFKRILGLRFAALYTTLAQLYLVADREPDHSIINLSLQLLTTPSITEEVVERGNFLTNIMAILYTFLTTRQVGEPQDVNPSATLAMDAGSITNRRLFHFFFDLRYLLPSDHVQTHVRTDRQYLLQFLDLMKLPQGICPNVRAIGEHVEYETDSWISASILMREINRLCRFFCEAFRPDKIRDDPDCLVRAISVSAFATMVHSVGLERKRFEQAEIKDLVHFKAVPYTEFEVDTFGTPGRHRIVDFAVERGANSFHHPLHYTLSWLIECGRGMPREKLREIMLDRSVYCKQKLALANPQLDSTTPDEIILAMFDFPLRVCAWLAQMKAGVWVRNGLSLRHQMGQYRAVGSRDMAYYRDLFMLQAAFVVCDPSRFLASVVDRFGISEWMKGDFEARQGFDAAQHLDVAEEFIHLLIILITERSSLTPLEDEATIQRDIISSDIAHTLCFKPLSFTELTVRISDKIVDSDYFQDVLNEVASFRPPDGLNDTGAFELKPEYIEFIDPYSAQYSKNQRDEAESIYRQWAAKQTGKKVSDVVFEPRLKSIPSGAFSQLTQFTQTPLFTSIVHRFLEYCLMHKIFTPDMTPTRVESLLHILLHLILLAVMEDDTDEDDPNRDSTLTFTSHMLTHTRTSQAGADMSVVGLLRMSLTTPAFEACSPKIRHIFKILKSKRPKAYAAETLNNPIPGDEDAFATPVGVDSEADTKKKKALDRQAKIMAQFQQQQQNFLNSQADIDWGIDDESDEEENPSMTGYSETKFWRYPSGNCILCQEETNDSRIYGTFALVTDSIILRQTPLKDSAFAREVINTPDSLDKSAEPNRPFGVASENREKVRRLDSTGGEVISEKQGLGCGFPPNHAASGPITTGCGHIMHYSCFEAYCTATQRRHSSQVARNHPERVRLKEFVCPLCKALGNMFLPIVWKGKEESYPGVLDPQEDFKDFLNEKIVYAASRSRGQGLIMGNDKLYTSGFQTMFADYISKNIITPLSDKITQATNPSMPESFSFQQPQRVQMPGLYPASEDFPALSPLHQVSTPDESPATELGAIYRRLRETLKSNVVPSRHLYQSGSISPDDLVYTDYLFKTFGFSVSAVEIAQRGVGSDSGTTLLDTISQSSLTHLRVLSDTVLSYASIGGLHNNASKTVHELRNMHRRKLCQLFLGHPGISGLTELAQDDENIKPLFNVDTFVFLAECSLAVVPVLDVDILHFVRLCYIAEILKSVFSYILRSDGLLTELVRGHSRQEMEMETGSHRSLVARRLFNWIVATHNDSCPEGYHADGAMVDLVNYQSPPDRVLESLAMVASKYALPFLRKAAILLYVQYGVDFSNVGTDCEDLSELDRLTTILRLPSVDDVLASFGKGEEDNPIESLAVKWIAHWNMARFAANSEGARRMAPSLSHPAIFELVGLPKFYDVLLDEANQRRCPNTGKELTDPSVCLFCGEIFCSQATCCRTGGRGGCNQHVDKCGKNIGLFINIRKCAVLVLHNSHGLWQYAPYLDIHGEVDLGYRHHRRLILNQKRYDRLLRDIWLSNAIPATVSRKLESEVNTGGWETL